MAVIDTPLAVGHGHGVTHNFAVALRSLRDTLVNWNDARLTRKALSKLTDRELDDIGLNRGDIDLIR